LNSQAAAAACQAVCQIRLSGIIMAAGLQDSKACQDTAIDLNCVACREVIRYAEHDRLRTLLSSALHIGARQVMRCSQSGTTWVLDLACQLMRAEATWQGVRKHTVHGHGAVCLVAAVRGLTARGMRLPAVLSSSDCSFSTLPSVCIGVPMRPGETQLMRRGASSAATVRVRCSTEAPTDASEIWPALALLAGVPLTSTMQPSSDRYSVPKRTTFA
jgi:hypothetical protein